MSAMRLEITDEVTPFLARLSAGLTDTARIHRYIAARAEQGTREHVRREAPSRHATAGRLGAKPTGHLERASESIESGADATTATVRFPRATGLHRAFQDLVILPKAPKKFLTIPVNARAYGRRAGEFADLFALRVGPRETLVLAQKVATGDTLEIMYLLVPSARVPQDRTLLPSDAQFLQLAELGAQDLLDDLETPNPETTP